MPTTVAELCKKHGISVQQLAQRTGLPDSRIQAIVLGRWTPSPDERTKVASQFGVSVQEIAWGHKTPIQHLYGHGPA